MKAKQTCISSRCANRIYAHTSWIVACGRAQEDSELQRHMPTKPISKVVDVTVHPNDVNQWAFEYQLKCVRLTLQRLLLIYCKNPVQYSRFLFLCHFCCCYISCFGYSHFHCSRSYRHNSHKSNYKQTLLKHCTTIKVTSTQTVLQNSTFYT